MQIQEPIKKTTHPIVTGASVMSLKYKGGVIMAADSLCSYGKMARYKNINRIHKISDNVLIGFGGELSDFQYIKDVLSEKLENDFITDDGNELDAKEIHSFLSRLMYNRRTKTDPLYNELVVAGNDSDGNSFLGYVNLYGTTFEEDIVTTGYATYICQAILRKGWSEDLDEKEARELLTQCLTVLYYRDCKAHHKAQIVTITDGGKIERNNIVIKSKWDHKRFVKPELTV